MSKTSPTPPADASARVTITPFPDGGLFRYVANPGRAGTFALLDVHGNTVALAVNAMIADILCRSVYSFVRALENPASPKTPDPQFLAGN